MGNYLDEKVKEFWGGFTVGGITGVNFLFTDAPTLGHVAIEYTFRFIGALMIAVTSGLCTAMALDLYKYKFKDKIFKPKQDGNKEKDDQSKAA